MTGLAAGGGGIGKGGWAFGTGGEAAARAERNSRDGWVGGMWTGGRVVPRADSHQLLSGKPPPHGAARWNGAERDWSEHAGCAAAHDQVFRWVCWIVGSISVPLPT
jgi:hypothetical protein